MAVNGISNPPLNWDDLRLILTIARAGSLSSAATELGINVSTASRRLSQVEGALGALCFIRRPFGVEPTDEGQIVIEHAREIEQQTVRLKHATAVRQTSRALHATITCTDLVGTALVIPALADLAQSEVDVSVNLNTDERLLDLHRGEADLAFRVRRPSNGGLRIRKIAEIGYGLFASRDYLDRAGRPEMLADLAHHQLIGSQTVSEHAAAMWWEVQCGLGRVTVRADRTIDRQHCAEHGLGITMLAMPVGKKALLERVLPLEKLHSIEVFQLAPPGALQIPHVREVAQQIAEFARRNASTLN